MHSNKLQTTALLLSYCGLILHEMSQPEEQALTTTTTTTTMPEEEEVEDEWEQVYSVTPFENFVQKGSPCYFLRQRTYYQTYGGGPEGGYVVLRSGSVFSVHRDWFIPFSSTKMVQKTLITRLINGGDGQLECKLADRTTSKNIPLY